MQKNTLNDSKAEILVITSNDALKQFCVSLLQEEFITVDTEFLRETTYYPKLCLIQVAGAHSNALIDPLAADLDLAPFFDLMADARIMKVFHAARQDVEIILRLTSKVPTPIFDTQIAAMVCGFGDQVGYEAIARKIAGASIDKSSQFTDWSRRPLTQKQIAYAISDVTHLRVIYQSLKDEISRENRGSWLESELADLADESTYVVEPEETWRRIKARIQTRKQQAALMEVSAWREREAQRKDVPRGRILKDEAIGEIAIQVPQSRADLAQLRLLPRNMAESQVGAGILESIEKALKRDPSTIPLPRSKQEPMPPAAESLVEILKLALKIISQNEQVAPKLLANSSDIEAFALDETADVSFLQGWRRKAFGEAALQIKHGKTVIGMKDGKATILQI
jgi:ribonuclease D